MPFPVLLDWVVFGEAGASGGTLPSNDHAPVASPAMVSQTPSAGYTSTQAITDVSEPPVGSGPGAPSLGMVVTVRLPLLAWLLSAIASQASDFQRKP